MNKALFKVTFKANWLIGIIILAIMLMYLGIIISMFDPESIEGIEGMLEVMPQELIAAMGFAEIGTTLTTFIASFFYTFLAIMFPIIFCITVANRLVAKLVDTGSMSYLLSSPNSRKKIVITQALFFLLSIFLLFSGLTLAGILFSEAFFPGELELLPFIQLNFVTMVAFFAVSGICFFFSCIFNKSSYSLALGTGVTVMFFVSNMLANMSQELSWLRYLSLFSLIKPMAAVEGNITVSTSVIIPLLIALIMYGMGIFIFDRRSLPL